MSLIQKHKNKYSIQNNGCWIWVASGGDYGCVYVNGKMLNAHKVFYEEVYGPVPDGLELDHKCKHTRCVNPEHLEAVTHIVNVSRSKVIKLTDVAIEKIISYRTSGLTYEQIARRVGLSFNTIARVCKGYRPTSLNKAQGLT